MLQHVSRIMDRWFRFILLVGFGSRCVCQPIENRPQWTGTISRNDEVNLLFPIETSNIPVKCEETFGLLMECVGYSIDAYNRCIRNMRKRCRLENKFKYWKFRRQSRPFYLVFIILVYVCSCLPSTLSVRSSLPHEWRLISIRHNHTRLVSMCETMQTVKRPLINDQKWNANTCLINCSFLLRIALSRVRITAETNSLNSSHIIQNQCNAMLDTHTHTYEEWNLILVPAQRRDAVCEWRKTIEN